MKLGGCSQTQLLHILMKSTDSQGHFWGAVNKTAHSISKGLW